MQTLKNSNGVVIAVAEKFTYSTSRRGWEDGSGVCYGDYNQALLVAESTNRITRLAFRQRFTQAEKVSMEIASIDNAAATMAQRQQAASLRVNLADTASAIFIDLADASTIAGVQSMETAGLLAAGRAALILNTPVTQSERFA